MNTIKLLYRTYPLLLVRFFTTIVLMLPVYFFIQWFIEFGRRYTGSKLIFIDVSFGYLGLAMAIIYISIIDKFLFHLIRYAHVAVMNSILDDKEIKGSQVLYGFKIMFSRFGSILAIYLVNNFMTKLVTEISKWIIDKSESFPSILKSGIFSRLISSILKSIIFSVLEVIMSYLYSNEDKNLVVGVKEGTVLYVKCWKYVLRSAFFTELWLKIFSWILKLLVISSIVWALWGKGLTLIISTYIFYKILCFVVGKTFLEAYKTASMLIGFKEGLSKINTEVPESLIDKLSNISEYFGDLVIKGKIKDSGIEGDIVDLFSNSLSVDEIPKGDILKLFKRRDKNENIE